VVGPWGNPWYVGAGGSSCWLKMYVSVCQTDYVKVSW